MIKANTSEVGKMSGSKIWGYTGTPQPRRCIHVRDIENGDQHCLVGPRGLGKKDFTIHNKVLLLFPLC